MAKGWHNTHISTKWGVVIIGFLLISVIILIPVLGQSQDPRSHASVLRSESATQSMGTTGKESMGKAPRGEESMGARPTPTPIKCRGKYFKSECKKTSECRAKGGVSRPGYCPGSKDFQCCIMPTPTKKPLKINDKKSGF
jgi:hypothetical protein